MIQLELPIRNLVENNRLGNDLVQGEIFRNSQTKVASHDPETIAGGFLEMGITDPHVTDRLLTVEEYRVLNRRMSRTNRVTVWSRLM